MLFVNESMQIILNLFVIRYDIRQFLLSENPFQNIFNADFDLNFRG